MLPALGVQVGGSDQWTNIQNGLELIRKQQFAEYEEYEARLLESKNQAAA